MALEQKLQKRDREDEKRSHQLSYEERKRKKENDELDRGRLKKVKRKQPSVLENAGLVNIFQQIAANRLRGSSEGQALESTTKTEFRKRPSPFQEKRAIAKIKRKDSIRRRMERRAQSVSKLLSK